MKRLTLYLLTAFGREGFALFAVVAFLIYVVQVLRLFDVVTARGQDILTLAGQAVLTAPHLAETFFYITLAIGVARALRTLQASRELHIIHASGKPGPIWSALFVFSAAAALFLVYVSNWIEPQGQQAYEKWSAAVAADLVGRSLAPNVFREIAPGLMVEIGGRGPNGEIKNFFAHDSREPGVSKTYQAKTAEVGTDASGYYLNLHDGSLQIRRPDQRFTDVAFAGYQLAIDKLASKNPLKPSLSTLTTPQILSAADGRPLTRGEQREIESRISEPLRLIALVFLVGAITGFPNANRRRNWFPIEVGVLAFGLIDRLLNNLWLPPFFSYSAGAAIMAAAALLILVLRYQGFRFARSRRQVA